MRRHQQLWGPLQRRAALFLQPHPAGVLRAQETCGAAIGRTGAGAGSSFTSAAPAGESTADRILQQEHSRHWQAPCWQAPRAPLCVVLNHQLVVPGQQDSSCSPDFARGQDSLLRGLSHLHGGMCTAETSARGKGLTHALSRHWVGAWTLLHASGSAAGSVAICAERVLGKQRLADCKPSDGRQVPVPGWKTGLPGWQIGLPGWRQGQLRQAEQRRSHMGHAGHGHHHGHAHGHIEGELQGVGGRGDGKGAKETEVISRVGLWSDVALTGAKGGAGWLSGSTALLADAAHSVSDIVLSWVTLWSVRAAYAPKDKEHPYGHGKFQAMGALAVSAVLVGTGAGIAWHALGVLQVLLPTVFPGVGGISGGLFGSSKKSGTEHGSGPLQGAGAQDGEATVEGLVHLHGSVHGHAHVFDMQNMEVALAVAVLSVGVKEGLFWATKIIGDRYDNNLIRANAWHHRSDSISSVAAAIGIGGAMAGVPILDPAAALLVSAMIIRAGASIAVQSSQELVDAGLPDSVLLPMKETVQSVAGVEGCHNMRGRRMGSNFHVDTHIEVDPRLTVAAAHEIGKQVQIELRKKFPTVSEVFVHVDPASPHKSG